MCWEKSNKTARTHVTMTQRPQLSAYSHIRTLGEPVDWTSGEASCGRMRKQQRPSKRSCRANMHYISFLLPLTSCFIHSSFHEDLNFFPLLLISPTKQTPAFPSCPETCHQGNESLKIITACVRLHKCRRSIKTAVRDRMRSKPASDVIIKQYSSAYGQRSDTWSKRQPLMQLLPYSE